MTYPRPNTKDTFMDKYNTISAFNKWLSPININLESLKKLLFIIDNTKNLW